jgi:Class II flagellar assembly regulator
MKIDPTQIRPATARRVGTAQSASSGGFAAALHEESAAAGGNGAVGGAVGLSGVSTVLALQGAPDSTERRARQRAVQRGDAMLDDLEQIRLGLLLGAIPRAKLEQLAQLVRARREQLDDPKLIAILDEIELRAAVELAKLAGSGGE